MTCARLTRYLNPNTVLRFLPYSVLTPFDIPGGPVVSIQKSRIKEVSGNAFSQGKE
jgi:hypothetical protein